MNPYWTRRCWLALLLVSTIFRAEGAAMLPDAFQIIPKPRQLAVEEGAGLAVDGISALRLVDSPRPVLPPRLEHLPLADEAGAGTLTLRLAADADLPESTEGYALTVRQGRATIAARGAAGIFYGCQTLAQLLEDAADHGVPVPALEIRDWPTLTYRAIHVDTKHHLGTLKYYYDLIDRLAAIKINGIIWEFEDKLGYRRQPAVAAPQHISLEEMAALTRYARERHIELSPLVQGLGHATFILKHDVYKHLREKPDDRWAFCPSRPETYEVQFDLYRDAMQATPGSRYLHVGGDEVSVGTCPRCRPIAEDGGAFVLNLMWLNKVCEFARQHGRIPIFWDDMIFNHAGVYRTTHSDVPPDEVERLWEKGLPMLEELLPRFPRDCVYMRWNYTLARQEGNLRALDWYREHGLASMIATAAQNTMPLLPEDDRVNIIESFTAVAAERGIGGMLCTAWDDSSPHMETYWRGLVAAGEYGWSPRGRSLSEYETAYLQRSFGPEARGATALYRDLSRSTRFWNRALVQQGERRHVQTLLDVPRPTHPGAWTLKHQERLETARQEIAAAEARQETLEALSRRARRNRYHLELLAAINRFQATPARLLAALEAGDSADPAQRKAAAAGVRAALADYENEWQALQEVFGRTRFLDYPGYVPDAYHHFASKRHDISFMVVVEERYHAEVRTWLEAVE